MEQLDHMIAFVKVVEAGSFSEAARELDVPKSTLSRRIARLEERLGAQLLHRTTRTVHLTDLGAAYYERCRQIVEDIRDAEDSVKRLQSEPQGLLRVTGPSYNGNIAFAKLFTDFLMMYPKVELDLLLTNRVVDLVQEGFDVALRGGRLQSSSLMARKLGANTHIVVASPDYLARRGTPQDVEALASHDCLLRDTGGAQGTRWADVHGNFIRVQGRMRADDIEILRHAAQQGLGLAMLPSPAVSEDLEAGRLVRVLEGVVEQQAGFYAIYPANRHLSAKVRAFVDFSAKHFSHLSHEWERRPALMP